MSNRSLKDQLAIWAVLNKYIARPCLHFALISSTETKRENHYRKKKEKEIKGDPPAVAQWLQQGTQRSNKAKKRNNLSAAKGQKSFLINGGTKF